MSTPLRILIIEDSDIAARAVLAELKRSGYAAAFERVDTAEALHSALSRQTWDIVVSDCSMPSFSGLEALRIVRSSDPDLPFIFVSGTMSAEVVRAAMRAGADGYLSKTDLHRLSRELEQNLLKASARRSVRQTTPSNESEQSSGVRSRSVGDLRALTARLQAVREEERTKVAREIHDELGQALTALKFELNQLFYHLPHGDQAVNGKSQSVLGHVDHIISWVRRIATQLRPAIVDRLGLSAAIEWAGTGFQDRTGIRTEISMPEEEIVLDPERRMAVFRIFQEALTNVARHSGATRVIIRLAQCKNDVVLEIVDNGKGAAEPGVSHSASLGILGMRERALNLNGQLEISGSPGSGTSVRLRVPAETFPSIEAAL